MIDLDELAREVTVMGRGQLTVVDLHRGTPSADVTIVVDGHPDVARQVERALRRSTGMRVVVDVRNGSWG